MVYITGDTHGYIERFSPEQMSGESEWTEDDYLIICGDFGFVYRDDEEENASLDALSEKPYTICFCDGNHENFNALSEYREVDWHGGRVHKIRKNVFHLMRGNVYDIDGKKFFAMGGAYSIDRATRIEGFSWWRDELPSEKEYKYAAENLEKHGKNIDYVITHTAPREIIRKMGEYPDMHDAELTGFLEWVMYEVEFKKWFFGHWHIDRNIDDKFRALLFDVVTIED
jgi:hypothetical protein